jgi:hypothetical protein
MSFNATTGDFSLCYTLPASLQNLSALATTTEVIPGAYLSTAADHQVKRRAHCPVICATRGCVHCGRVTPCPPLRLPRCTTTPVPTTPLARGWLPLPTSSPTQPPIWVRCRSRFSFPCRAVLVVNSAKLCCAVIFWVLGAVYVTPSSASASGIACVNITAA